MNQDILTVPKDSARETLITFSMEAAEIMRLDDRGMVYKGRRIEDAGEAHRAFLEVMATMKAASV